jgi:hypothetical protein
MKKADEAQAGSLCHQGLIMREIIKDIEQLEVAGELIDKNTPTASKLARPSLMTWPPGARRWSSLPAANASSGRPLMT